MSTEKLKTEVRREQIAHAVLALASLRGVRGLSAAAVARRVGIVPSAIYRHFRSMDEALDAALDLARARLLGSVERAAADVPGALDRLHRLFVGHMRMIRENRILPRIVFSDDVIGGPPGRKARARAVLHGFLERIAALAAEGQERGELRDDLEPKTVAVMFLGLIQPAAILAMVSDGEFDLTGHSGSAWEVFRETMEARGARKGRTGGRR